MVYNILLNSKHMHNKSNMQEKIKFFKYYLYSANAFSGFNFTFISGVLPLYLIK